MSATFEHAIATIPPRERSGRAFRVVRIVLGLLLLTAGGLKLYGMNVTALPRAGWFATPRVQIMAAEWELVLGLWLLSGVFQFGAWLAAIGTFATFAGVSAYFGWIGVANCGCFGVIHTSPWVAFAVDVAALVGLGLLRPSVRFNSFRMSNFAALISVMTFVALLVLAGVGSALYSSPWAALAQLRGDNLTTSVDYIDFGSGPAGNEVERTIEIWNWTERPVRLIGGTSDCSCVTTANLPLTIPSGECRKATILMRIPKSQPGAVTRVVELFTAPGQPGVRFRIGCQVEE